MTWLMDQMMGTPIKVNYVMNNQIASKWMDDKTTDKKKITQPKISISSNILVCPCNRRCYYVTYLWLLAVDLGATTKQQATQLELALARGPN